MKLNTKLFSIIMLSFVVLSCSSNDDTVVVPDTNTMTVSVDGENYKIVNENVYGNENCGGLFVKTYYHDKDKIQFRLNINIDTLGHLQDVWYDEYILPINTSQNMKVFLTPKFNPTSTFKISNFQYNYTTGALSFDFSGIVFLENGCKETRNVIGKVNIKSIKTVDCSIAKTGIEYTSNAINLFTGFDTGTEYSDQSQVHRFFTNNGYILDINVDKDFWIIPLGSIEFDESSVDNKVSLFKYIGDQIASQLPILKQTDWKTYDTKGSIVIERKVIENGYKKIVGKINMDVLDNNTVLYHIEGMKFSVGSFVDY